MRRRGDDTRVTFFSFQDIITSLAGIVIFISLLMVLDLSTTAFSPPQSVATTLTEDDLRRELTAIEEQRKQVELEMAALAAQSESDADIDPAMIAREIKELEDEIARLSVEEEVETAEQRARRERYLLVKADVHKTHRELRSIAVTKRKIENVARRVVFSLPDDERAHKDVVIFEFSAPHVLMTTLRDPSIKRSIEERSGAARRGALVKELAAFPPLRFDMLLVIKPSSFADETDWVEFFGELGYRVGSEPLEEDRSVVAGSE